MTIRAALYARFSTDKQSDASIDDQHRVCEQLAARHGFEVVARFSDAAISGGTARRPGYQAMLAAARRHEFDVIVAEDCSRLWRLLSEQAPRLAELHDLGVHVVTHDLDTREESAAILGAVNGAMAEAYRREIGRRTRRGLEGRALAGKPAGGRAYGYIPASQSGTGEIEIDPAQAAVVRRIYELYADGMSPRAIAETLNAEGVPSPGSSWQRVSRRKSKWLASAIWGDPSKGLGILNNPLYRGVVIWGREKWIRSRADSSKRRRVPVPESEWITREEPRLRIIPEELWQRVKRRQTARAEGVGVHIREGLARVPRTKPGRPNRYLLSGLLRCPECGSSYSIVAHGLYACSSFTNGGPSACSNGVRFRRTEAETQFLAGLRERLLQQDAMAYVRKAVVAAIRRQVEPPKDDGREKRIAALEREIENLSSAIALHGVNSRALVDRLTRAEAALEQAKRHDEPPIVGRVEKLLPGVVDRYRAFVEELAENLSKADVDRARAELRRMYGPITARPENGVVRLEIEGAQVTQALVKACGGRAAGIVDGNLVAGAGFEPATFGL